MLAHLKIQWISSNGPNVGGVNAKGCSLRKHISNWSHLWALKVRWALGKSWKHNSGKARKSWRRNLHWQGRAVCHKVSLYCWICVIDKTKNDPICLNRISCDTDGWVVKSNKEKAYPTFLHIIPTVEIVDIQVKLKFIIVLTRFIFFSWHQILFLLLS